GRGRARSVFPNRQGGPGRGAEPTPLVPGGRPRRFEAARKAGARVAVAEASQLLEAGTESEYDRVLLVTAPAEVRIRRWQASGGRGEDARRRMSAQLPPEEAAARASDVLVNDGTPEELQRKVERLYEGWL